MKESWCQNAKPTFSAESCSTIGTFGESDVSCDLSGRPLGHCAGRRRRVLDAGQFAARGKDGDFLDG